ncbi:MAG: calcium/sodium antiporter [Bacillota bacterium]
MGIVPTLCLLIVLILVGFVLIIKGGDIFVDGAVEIATATKIPSLLIGATIVSIGTTLPEITVSYIAAFQGDASLAVSNSVGSMLCNVALILGVALSFAIAKLDKKSFISKIAFVILVTSMTMIFIIDLTLTFVELIALFLIFFIFIAVNVTEAIKKSKEATESSEEVEKYTAKDMAISGVKLLVGGFAIFVGAQLLVNNVSIIATDYLKISTTIVGFTIVAFGTSLPELATSINAIKKKNIDLSIGNVMGANVINASLIVGGSGLLASRNNAFNLVLDSSQMGIIIAGVAALLISVLILVIPILIKSRTYKIQGISMIAIYFAYLAYILSTVI